MIEPVKKFFNEFKEFAVKGNMIDLAVGIIVGTAFNQIVNSLVTNIVLPPIGLLINRVDFSDLFVSLNGVHYASVAAAQAAGAPILNYGLFLNNVINFIITAFVVFLVVRQINRIKRRHDEGKPKPQEEPPTSKQCPFCFSTIPIKATRCPQCTSTLTQV